MRRLTHLPGTTSTPELFCSDGLEAIKDGDNNYITGGSCDSLCPQGAFTYFPTEAAYTNKPHASECTKSRIPCKNAIANPVALTEAYIPCAFA